MGACMRLTPFIHFDEKTYYYSNIFGAFCSVGVSSVAIYKCYNNKCISLAWTALIPDCYCLEESSLSLYIIYIYIHIYYPPPKTINLWGIMIWAPSVLPPVHLSKICSSGWISPTPMNICFLVLYTCIYYNLSMNPVKFCLEQIQNGWLIAIFVGSNWQNIWK